MILLVFNILGSGDDNNAEVDYDDNYDTDGNLDDGVAWIDDGLQVRLESQTYSEDVVCYDWDYDGTMDKCYGCSSTDLSNCRSDSSVLDGWCNGDTTCYTTGCSTEKTLTNNYVHRHRVDVRYYSDCTGTGSYSWWDVDPEYHTVVNRKRILCYSSGSDNFYIEARYETGPDEYYTVESHDCESYELCDTDHDNVYTTTETYDLVGLYNPCRIVEGSGANNQCDDYEDCYDDAICDGAQTVYTVTCDLDGGDGFHREVDQYSDTCGGSGYNYDSSEDDPDCSDFLTPAYVCDADLDGVFYDSFNILDFCKKGPHQSCSVDSDCWNDNGGYDCIGGSCEKCGDSYCGSGETPSSCPSDCCYNDCRKIPGEGPPSSDTCYSACDNYNGCDFYSSATETACDGEDKDNTVCVDEDTYVTCCEGTPSDCSGNEYCSSGSCLTCSTACDDQCQSSACYGTDPDCDENGDPTLQCGDETDLAILDVIPIQVIPNVNMVKDKSGYVRVIVHNYGPLNATGQVNVTFDGISLTPYNPANASKFILNGMNESFDFNFKPEVAGNNKVISANVTIVN